MYSLTYRRDPASSADKDFRTGLAPRLTAETGGDVDLRPYCTETNQLNLSSCAGNATADSIEVINAIAVEKAALAAGQPVPPVAQLSRLFVYTMARGMMDENNDGQEDIDKDKGTYIRLCFQVLAQYGICDEHVWPYDPSKVYTTPSLMALRQATGHRIHSFYRINEEGESRLDAVRTALRAKHPVVFGTQITESFMSLRGLGPVQMPQGPVEGGHAMLIVGVQGDNFLVKNSWGKGWGGGGYWLMTGEYLMWDDTSDLWVPTFGSMFP